MDRFDSQSVPLPGDSSASASTVDFGMDSVRVTITAGGDARSYAMNPAPEASIFLPFSFALYEQLVRRTLGRGVDSAAAELVFPGVFNPLPTSVRRLSADSASLDYFGAPLLLRIDRAGRILGADASATTQKVTVTRERRADIAGLARTFAARDSAEGPPGQLSPRDTVRATVGNAEIRIDYGRPRMRGRQIMGHLVPWNQVWRTGANAATGLTTDRDITIGGAVVPAGSYTLWTLPTRDGATLIVNRQTGQWGTDYQASEDLVRIPLVQRRLAEPVDTFTIALDSAGALRISWDRTEWETEVR